MIALADCNNFYVSCERIFNPKIQNKPVVVLSNNDGCIISRSNEAKSIGIKMGEPAFKYRDIFIKYNVNIFSTNFALYSDMSDRVMSILSKSISNMEIYSIDEAFMDYSGLHDPFIYAFNMRKKIIKWTGIPLSIGIAETKTLAKVANKIAKKKIKSGIFYLNCSYEIKEHLKKICISKLWGIGNSYTDKLFKLGVRTAYDLTSQSDKWVKKYLSISGLKLVNELRGIPCYKLNTVWKRKQSISTSRTFNKEIKSLDRLVEIISTYASISSIKLRREGSCAKSITVFITTNRFSSKDNCYLKGVKTIQLRNHTNNSMKIISAAISALKSIYRENYLYKKAGIILSDINSDANVQIDIFDDINDIKKCSKIMQVVDKINDDYSRMYLRFAVCGIDKNWELRQQYLSPCYTTKISDLMNVYT